MVALVISESVGVDSGKRRRDDAQTYERRTMHTRLEKCCAGAIRAGGENLAIARRS